ncbi:MAG: LysR family transcriptional regulator [Kofleriaceae bacterium]
MHIPWSEIELVVAIAETGSLSKAAGALRITQPTVSRRLADLEAELGEPLFVRTVEGTALTAFGERLLGPARRMAECAGELERVAAGAEASPRGVVRITAAPGLAHDFLAPFAARVRDQLPEVQLEVLSTIHYLDLTRREADLALRFQPLSRPDTRRALTTIASIQDPVTAFASRAYARTLPRGYRLADVAWVGWPPSHDHLPPNPQLAAQIPGFRPSFASDDFVIQLRAAEAGLGAILLSRMRDHFGLPTQLVPLDLDFGKLTSTVHLICARSSLAIPRVRAVAELLADELAKAGRRRAS